MDHGKASRSPTEIRAARHAVLGRPFSAPTRSITNWTDSAERRGAQRPRARADRRGGAPCDRSLGAARLLRAVAGRADSGRQGDSGRGRGRAAAAQAEEGRGEAKAAPLIRKTKSLPTTPRAPPPRRRSTGIRRTTRRRRPPRGPSRRSIPALRQSPKRRRRRRRRNRPRPPRPPPDLKPTPEAEQPVAPAARAFRGRCFAGGRKDGAGTAAAAPRAPAAGPNAGRRALADDRGAAAISVRPGGRRSRQWWAETPNPGISQSSMG